MLPFESHQQQIYNQYQIELNCYSIQSMINKVNSIECSFKEAEKVKIICGTSPKKCKGAVLNIVKGTMQALAKEITNAENFYESHFSQSARGLEIILCGGGASMLNIDKNLGRFINRPIIIADPLINIIDDLPAKQKESFLPYTTAIGLGLRNII